MSTPCGLLLVRFLALTNSLLEPCLSFGGLFLSLVPGRKVVCVFH